MKHLHNLLVPATPVTHHQTMHSKSRRPGWVWTLLLLLTTAWTLTGCGQPAETFQMKQLADLDGKRLSVQAGTIGEDLALEKSADGVKRFSKYTEAILAVKQGKVEACILDEQPAQQMLKAHSDLEIFETPLQEESYAVAIAPENAELLVAANTVIQKWNDAGTMKEWVQSFQEAEAQAAEKQKKEWTALEAEFPDSVLIMGTEAGFAPYETKMGDAVVGADIALALQIARERHAHLKVVDLDFDALIPALLSGKVDLVAAGMTMTEERAKQVAFTLPYMQARQVAVVRKSSLAH